MSSGKIRRGHFRAWSCGPAVQRLQSWGAVLPLCPWTRPVRSVRGPSEKHEPWPRAGLGREGAFSRSLTGSPRCSGCEAERCPFHGQRRPLTRTQHESLTVGAGAFDNGPGHENPQGLAKALGGTPMTSASSPGILWFSGEMGDSLGYSGQI